MLADFVLYVAVGFAAQLVDGAIGMAYGLSGTTVMLSFGIPRDRERQRSCRGGVHHRHLRLFPLALRQCRLGLRLAGGPARHDRRRHRRLSADGDPGDIIAPFMGGALAAPIAAYAAYKIPDQPLMVLVGSVIMLLSTRGLIRAIG